MKKTNMYLDAMNGFVDAFELEQEKIGTKSFGGIFVYTPIDHQQPK